MNVGKKLFRLLGGSYNMVYRIPVIGDWIVRGVCRLIGLMGYHSPMCPKHFDSIDEFIEFLKNTTGAGGINIEIENRGEDRFEIILEECPYLFSKPCQVGVCEAAMDMDRTLFGRCGYEIIIKESLPRGDPVCREVFKMKSK